MNREKLESVKYVLSHVDNAIQYGEDLEPKEPALDEDDNAKEEYNEFFDN